MGLIDLYRIFYSNIKEYTLYLAAMETSLNYTSWDIIQTQKD